MRHDLIMDHVRRLAPSRILEIGIGMGAMGTRLAAAAEYVGVEPDPDSRQAARRVLPARTRLVTTVAEIGDEAFDLVCAFEVLEHIEDDAGALRQWREHITPAGHLLLSVPAHQERFGAWDTLAGHLRRYDPDDLEGLLEGEGFEVERLEQTGFPLGYLLEGLRHRIAAREASGASVAQRISESGRQMQLSRGGFLTRTGSWPFRKLQRYFPDRGTGIVVLASRST